MKTLYFLLYESSNLIRFLVVMVFIVLSCEEINVSWSHPLYGVVNYLATIALGKVLVSFAFRLPAGIFHDAITAQYNSMSSYIFWVGKWHFKSKEYDRKPESWRVISVLNLVSSITTTRCGGSSNGTTCGEPFVYGADVRHEKASKICHLRFRQPEKIKYFLSLTDGSVK